MIWIPKWIVRRRERDEDAILDQLYYLAPQSAWPLAEATGIRLPRLYAALDRLEDAGLVLSQWSKVTYPRRRMYSLPPRHDIDEGWRRG